MSRTLLREMLQRVANAEPSGNGVTALHPTEYPWNSSEVVEATALRPTRWPRPDARGIEFVHRSRLFEIFQDVRVVSNVAPVDRIGLLGHFLSCLLPRGRMRRSVFSRPRQGFQARCNHQFQIPFRKHRVGIFPIEHFALFGDPNSAGKTSGWLREDC